MNRYIKIEYIKKLKQFCFRTSYIELGNIKFRSNINEGLEVCSVLKNTSIHIKNMNTGMNYYVDWDKINDDELSNLYVLISINTMV
jgi:hypothetical protein